MPTAAQTWRSVRVGSGGSKEPWIRQFVSFDGSKCYAFGSMGLSDPAILVSHDTGKTWQSLLIDFKSFRPYYNLPNYNLVSMPDTNSMYLSCDGGRILRSFDGGTNWDQVIVDSSLATAYQKFFRGIYFDRSGSGAIISESAYYWTSDRGSTWQKRVYTAPDTSTRFIEDVKFFSVDTFYVWFNGPGRSEDSTRSNFCSSYDGARSWTVSHTTPQWHALQMCFIDKENGWVASSRYAFHTGSTARSIVYHTSDAGNNWVTQLDSLVDDSLTHTLSLGITHIDFFDPMNGLATGNSQILRTYNGGKTWYSQSRDIAVGSFEDLLWPVAFISNKVALCANTNGGIIRSDDALQSVDLSVTSDLNATVFPNPSSDLIKVIVSGEREPMTILLVDALGRVVHKFEQLESEIVVRVDDLASGVYLLRVSNAQRATTIPFSVVR